MKSHLPPQPPGQLSPRAKISQFKLSNSTNNHNSTEDSTKPIEDAFRAQSREEKIAFRKKITQLQKIVEDQERKIQELNLQRALEAQKFKEALLSHRKLMEKRVIRMEDTLESREILLEQWAIAITELTLKLSDSSLAKSTQLQHSNSTPSNYLDPQVHSILQGLLEETCLALPRAKTACVNTYRRFISTLVSSIREDRTVEGRDMNSRPNTNFNPFQEQVEENNNTNILDLNHNNSSSESDEGEEISGQKNNNNNNNSRKNRGGGGEGGGGKALKSQGNSRAGSRNNSSSSSSASTPSTSGSRSSSRNNNTRSQRRGRRSRGGGGGGGSESEEDSSDAEEALKEISVSFTGSLVLQEETQDDEDRTSPSLFHPSSSSSSPSSSSSESRLRFLGTPFTPTEEPLSSLSSSSSSSSTSVSDHFIHLALSETLRKIMNQTEQNDETEENDKFSSSKSSPPDQYLDSFFSKPFQSNTRSSGAAMEK